jgi:hypothetical protein
MKRTRQYKNGGTENSIYKFGQETSQKKKEANGRMPVTVTERSKACTVFARSEVVIVGSNPTQGMDILCVYVFILCLCCPVFR